MSDPMCAVVRADLAEAALALLDEPARSDVLAHVGACVACRAQFDELVRVADRLVAAAPEAEPPPGFEQRVLARLDAASRDGRAGARWRPTRGGRVTGRWGWWQGARRRRRWLVPAVVAGAVLVALVGGVVAGRAADDDRVQALAAVGIDRLDVAELRDGDGNRVGSVAIAREGVPVFLLRLDRYRAGVTYECQLVLADGRVVRVGSWSSEGSSEVAWSSSLPPLDAAPVEALVLGGDGSVWLRGRLD